MNQQGRNKLGKFSPKSDENRQVRSIRLTDTAWNALGELADVRGITRADLLEEWFIDGSFSLDKIIKNLELEINNIKSSSVCLPKFVLNNLNKVASERGITREELVIKLLDSCAVHNLTIESAKHTQLDLLPEHKLDNKSDALCQPLNNNSLAKRLGVDPSNLKKQMLKGEDKLLNYSTPKDPNGWGWKYSPEEKLYYPVLN